MNLLIDTKRFGRKASDQMCVQKCETLVIVIPGNYKSRDAVERCIRMVNTGREFRPLLQRMSDDWRMRDLIGVFGCAMEFGYSWHVKNEDDNLLIQFRRDV